MLLGIAVGAEDVSARMRRGDTYHAIERVRERLGLPPGSALQILSAANAYLGIVPDPMSSLPQQLAVIEVHLGMRSTLRADAYNACPRSRLASPRSNAVGEGFATDVFINSYELQLFALTAVSFLCIVVWTTRDLGNPHLKWPFAYIASCCLALLPLRIMLQRNQDHMPIWAPAAVSYLTIGAYDLFTTMALFWVFCMVDLNAMFDGHPQRIWETFMVVWYAMVPMMTSARLELSIAPRLPCLSSPSQPTEGCVCAHARLSS